LSKEKEKKEYFFKSKFFLKLFGIPSICCFLLELMVKDVPNDDGSTTTWPELLQETFIVIAVWLIISFIIALVVNEVRKSKPKTKIVKEVQYITKPDDKITVKPEEMKEEIKKELKEEMKKEAKKKKNEKCLFSCESVVDGYEYKKMAKYFSKRMYWVFVIRGTIFNVIISALIALTTQSWIATLIFLIAYEIYLLIYYKVRLEQMAEKVHNARLKRGEIEVNFETEFYEDYFIRKGEKSSVTIDYSEITRCVENDTNFYLEYAKKNMIIIIQKNRCDLELISFIRNKFSNLENNLENNLGDTSSYKGIKKAKNTKLINTLMIILFIATLCCLWGAVWSVSLINEINPQHGFNFTKNTWVFWCWLPIPISSIILGFIYNGKGLKCTKNIVAGFIIGFLLLVYGAFSLFPTFSEDYSKINDYKQYIDASIPSNGELEIQNWETYFDDDKTEYAIINAYYDKEDVSILENSIEESNNWILSTKLKSELKILLPTQFRSSDNVYYSIYNKTTNEYNTIPNESGEYEIYSMYYDKSLKQLSIHKYKYNFNK
jgi:membrane protein